MEADDRFGDFTGLREIALPVTLAPRKGKYYGTEILDARGAGVVTLWTAVGDPSEREKAGFGSRWTATLWDEYCCDSHWGCESDYNAARALVAILNEAMRPVYRGDDGFCRYACLRSHFNVSELAGTKEIEIY